MWCTCTQKHLQLRGTCRAKGVPWTQVAEPYPRGLCRMLAAAVSTGVGWALKRGLNVAECAKTGTLRVGEAKNPGPRPAKSRHAFSLEEVNTVSAATLAIESRVLHQFFCMVHCLNWRCKLQGCFHKSPGSIATLSAVLWGPAFSTWWVTV
jgi:hypothetical protein